MGAYSKTLENGSRYSFELAGGEYFSRFSQNEWCKMAYRENSNNS